MKKDPVIKICLAGLFLALTIIFTRFFSLQNIPLIPFIRLSLGPSLIIFSSIFLGPFYGAIIGGLSDILGIILVPNSAYGINPWFTLVYTLLGILPWCFYKLSFLLKKENISLIAFITILIGLLTFVGIYGFSHETINNQNYQLGIKIIVFVSLILLSGLMVFLIIYISKKHSFGERTFKIALVSLLSELLVLLILNSIVKSLFFEIDFFIIFFFQTLVFFIDVPLNTLVVSFLMTIADKANINRGQL